MTQPTLLVGHHYQTRCGGVVKIVHQELDLAGTDCEFVGVVIKHPDDTWPVPYAQSYLANGQVLDDDLRGHDDDAVALCPPPRKPVTGWVNVYESGVGERVYKTKAHAEEVATSCLRDRLLTTVFVKECDL